MNPDYVVPNKSSSILDQSLENISPSKVMRPLNMHFHRRNISEIVVL
jgi:hypothetical protein